MSRVRARSKSQVAFVMDKRFMRDECLLGQDVGCFRSRRPGLNLIADERSELLRRSDGWLEAELVHRGLRLGCRQSSVDLMIETIHDVRRRSCRSPKSDPISPRQLREPGL